MTAKRRKKGKAMEGDDDNNLHTADISIKTTEGVMFDGDAAGRKRRKLLYFGVPAAILVVVLAIILGVTFGFQPNPSSSSVSAASAVVDSSGAVATTEGKDTAALVQDETVSSDSSVAATNDAEEIVAVPSTTDQQQTQTNQQSPTESTTSSSSGQQQQAQIQQAPTYTGTGTYQLLETIPHDASSFTQGLYLLQTAANNNNNPIFFESTGMYGESQVRKLDATDGSRVLQSVDLPSQYFGEGMAYYEVFQENGTNKEGRLIQITWKERTGFIYDSDTLEVLKTFNYNTVNGEGWGITHVPIMRQNSEGQTVYRNPGSEFIVSDGTNFLTAWDFKTLEEKVDRRVPVTLLRKGMTTAAEIKNINELEWDSFRPNTLLANVWYQDVLLRIDIQTGFVHTVYDLATLFTKRPEGADVLNGIALTQEPDVIWVTGKYWPTMYRIRLMDPSI